MLDSKSGAQLFMSMEAKILTGKDNGWKLTTTSGMNKYTSKLEIKTQEDLNCLAKLNSL